MISRSSSPLANHLGPHYHTSNKSWLFTPNMSHLKTMSSVDHLFPHLILYQTLYSFLSNNYYMWEPVYGTVNTTLHVGMLFVPPCNVVSTWNLCMEK